MTEGIDIINVIDLDCVTARELWDAIALIDCRSVCPGLLVEQVKDAISENRFYNKLVGKKVIVINK